jgi:hypothetical protein
MADADERHEKEPLTGTERVAASIAAVVLLGLAVWVILDPPDRTVALGGCTSAADGCLVTVDGDVTTIAAALFALGAGAGLIALLGVRFTSVKAAGVELSREYKEKTEGLPTVGEQQRPGSDEVGGNETRPHSDERRDVEPAAESPVRVEIVSGLGEELGVVPVAVSSLERSMDESQGRFLRDYQSARRISQNGWFLTHILGPAKSPRQEYSVAIKVTPHRDATEEVKAAKFFFGRAWGYKVFEGSQGADGRFGCTTEAYGPFMALCEVEFTSGKRLLLDHYCDFEMGALATD